MHRLIRGRGESLTERQYHGLGLVTAVLAYCEFGNRHHMDQLGKVPDAFHVPARTRASGQALSRGVGEGTFLPEREENPEHAIVRLINGSQTDFGDNVSTR